MLYKSLYFSTYSLALRSQQNRDYPWVISMLIVFLCLMFNIQTIYFLIASINGYEYFIESELLQIVILLLLLSLILFYSYNIDENYKKISKKQKEQKIWFSIIVIGLHYFGSLFILFIAAFYKNKDWIFST